MAMYSPEFKSKLISTRRIKLEELLQKYIARANQSSSSSSSGKTPTKKPIFPTPLSQALFGSSSPNQPEIGQLCRKLACFANVTSQSSMELAESQGDPLHNVLQQVLYWSLNSDPYQFPSKTLQNEVIETCKKLVQHGITYNDIGDQRKRGSIVLSESEQRFLQVAEQFQKSLHRLFSLLKESLIIESLAFEQLTSSFESVKSISPSISSTSSDGKKSPLNQSLLIPQSGHGFLSKSHKEALLQALTSELDAQTSRASKEITTKIDVTEPLLFQNLISDIKFILVNDSINLPQLYIKLREVGSVVKEFASSENTNYEYMSKLVDSAKELLRKGNEIKKNNDILKDPIFKNEALLCLEVLAKLVKDHSLYN